MDPFLLLIALHICMYWLLFICVTYDRYIGTIITKTFVFSNFLQKFEHESNKDN